MVFLDTKIVATPMVNKIIITTDMYSKQTDTHHSCHSKSQTKNIFIGVTDRIRRNCYDIKTDRIRRN